MVKPIEEVVHGIERRHYERPVSSPYKVCQILLEKDQRPSVGKEEAGLLYVSALEVMGGHLLKKRYHNLC